MEYGNGGWNLKTGGEGVVYYKGNYDITTLEMGEEGGGHSSCYGREKGVRFQICSVSPC